VTKGFKEYFKELHNFSLNCGLPMSSVLVTNREVCHHCNKSLVVEEATCCRNLSHFARDLSQFSDNEMLSTMQNIQASQFLVGKWQALF
jgi:hypothetical protein